MSEQRHYDFANLVMTMLKAQDLGKIRPGDIRLEKFPFHKEPSRGLVISLIDESEGTGLNDRDDIRYGIQLTRIKPELHHSDGMPTVSEWRTVVRELFHRKRIGLTVQELLTTVKPGTIHLKTEWKQWNIDTSIMRVFCLVREIRGNNEIPSGIGSYGFTIS